MSGTRTTKIAFAHWDNRIAPVFDTARQIHVVEADSGQIVSETKETLPEDPPVRKALRLVELGVGTLVCGAISRPMHGLVIAYGIQVVSFVAGDLREVIRAWLSNDLGRNAFAMPGCCGRGRNRGMLGINKDEYKMSGEGRGGAGTGGGAGRGGGQGRGRTGGPLAAGAVGTCLCPACGHREPHERGVPCIQKQCPMCGTAMTRQ